MLQCSARHNRRCAGWQKHLGLYQSVLGSDNQPLQWHKAMHAAHAPSMPPPWPGNNPAMAGQWAQGIAAESASKGTKPQALCAKRSGLWGAVAQWPRRRWCRSVPPSTAALQCLPQPDKVLFCNVPVPARHSSAVQCRRTGKALVPLFALTACKCSNRVFSTPPASGHRKPGQCRPGVRVACLASGAGTKPRCIGSSAAPRHSLYRQRQKGHRRICRCLLFHRVNPWTFAKAQNLAYSLQCNQKK